MNPHLDDWSTDTDLLAAILHALQGANWQRAGGKGTAPKPIDRPKPPQHTPQGGPQSADQIPDVDDSGSYSGESLPISEMAEWLGWS